MSEQKQTDMIVDEDKPMVPAPEAANIISVIERAAKDPNIDVQKMEKLLEMKERILDKQAEHAFGRAMIEAQKKIVPIAANAENKQTRSKYTSYDVLDRAIRPIYTEAGFSLSFGEGDTTKDQHVRVVCYVTHEAGHTRTYHADIPADGKGAKGGDVMTKTHATGSAYTYGKRYLLKMIFNIAEGDKDDDGNAAGMHKITEQQAADLSALISEYPFKEPDVLAHYKLKSWLELPVKNFETVCQEIRAKGKRALEGQK